MLKFVICLAACILAESGRNIALNRAVIHSSSVDFDHAGHLTTNGLKTDCENYWESKTNQIESLRIDLGVVSSFSQIRLHFKGGFADKYTIEISNNTENWKVIYKTENGIDGENVALFDEAVGSFVRIIFEHSGSGLNYRIANVEVIGHNEMPLKVQKKPRRIQNADDGKQYLSWTDTWHLIREQDANGAKGEDISTGSYKVDGWVEATVPGTVLVSYINNGAVPDPNYSDQFLQISEAFYWNNFWYHDVFQVDIAQRGKIIWLNFDGINWKADIFLNGRNIGHIDGAFMRGKYDITSLVRFNIDVDPNNYLAVLIYKNDNPGAVHVRTEESLGPNGGDLGRDNPTFHAAIGWDWIPTIPGRDIGIYNNVFLTFTGALQLIDPWVETTVNFSGTANVATLTLHTGVQNAGVVAVNGATVVGVLTPGNLKFTGAVNLTANATGTVNVALRLENPRLWYPNRYGEQFLYNIAITVQNGDEVSDTSTFEFGVRQLDYVKEGDFKIYVNNKRIFCSGGNWGMPEAFMRANTYEDFDIRVRLHKEAGFTCIRNWVGMTGFEDFYRACTKYGILIHEDFWLANPVDGPNPTNNTMFHAAAIDKIRVVRKYTAVGYYCGRNEGDPPAQLDTWLHDDTLSLDGTRYYVSDSAGNSTYGGTVLTGRGPYTIQSTDFYFKNGNENFHTERGLPNIPSVESIKEFIPADHLWPTDLIWAQHDFPNNSAQDGGHFKDVVRTKFGVFNTLAEFVARSQLAQYEAHKAMFEGHAAAKGNAMLLWMSMSCWPSFVWQTFDFFYDTNGGYFGCKTGNQRVNPIFNVVAVGLEVINNCGLDFSNLIYEFWAFNLNGTQTNYVTKQFALQNDEVIHQIVQYDLKATGQGTYFIQTKVTDGESGEVLGENAYWVDASNKIDNFTDLQTVANTTLNVTTQVLRTEPSPYGGNINFLAITLENIGKTPAIMARIKLLKRISKKRVLPTYYSNNYITVMPGQAPTIRVEFDDKYLDGEAFDVFYEGFNVAETQAK